MKNLSKSTWVLIVLAILTVALATTLLLTMPKEWSKHLENIKLHREHSGYTKDSRITSGQDSSESYGINESSEHHPYFFKHHRPGLFLLVIAGIIIFFVVKKRRHGRFNFSRKDNSKEILEEQFAEGKISKEEYKRKIAVLENL